MKTFNKLSVWFRGFSWELSSTLHGHVATVTAPVDATSGYA